MELGGIPSDQYAGYIEEESDLEYSECSEGESSGDEHGFIQCARRDYNPECSEDEFEREMESEVMGALKLMASPTAIQAATRKTEHMASSLATSHTAVQATSHGTSGDASGQKPPVEAGVAGLQTPDGPSTSSGKQDVETEYYDDIYFDSSSGSDEGGGAGEGVKKRKERKRGKVRKLTNDELFYDPHMDEEDEKWVARQRMAYHNVKESRQLEHKKKQRVSFEEDGGGTKDTPTENESPQSDAILNCPACMTTLCLDCQRHDIFVNQYRAMFVLNCQIVRDEVLKYAPKLDKKSRKRRRKQEEKMAVDAVQEDFNPVRCSECNTEVAVYDKDEVFHFFNVLASAP